MAVYSPWDPKFKYHKEEILNTKALKKLQLIQQIAPGLDIIQTNRNIWSQYFTETFNILWWGLYEQEIDI